MPALGWKKKNVGRNSPGGGQPRDAQGTGGHQGRSGGLQYKSAARTREGTDLMHMPVGLWTTQSAVGHLVSG